jgi:acyl-CoA synthetase (AMP-forming)/AMP-acid ligase II
VVSGYGMTEAAILTMNDAQAPDAVLAETEGPAVDGAQLRIVTLDGKDAGIGEEGEIRAKGPQVTAGYLDPALDADAFDEHGWFRTGDLGRVDQAGNLTITGRLKDVIIRKGENISAKEVEDLLFTHPQVADVAVVGLQDAERGERVCAVVVTAPGEGRHHLRGDVPVPARRRPHHPQAARAARGRRRPAPQPVGQGREVRAAEAVRRLGKPRRRGRAVVSGHGPLQPGDARQRPAPVAVHELALAAAVAVPRPQAALRIGVGQGQDGTRRPHGPGLEEQGRAAGVDALADQVDLHG